MPRQSSKTTTQRGLGYTHQQHRAGLIRRHTDGTPCWWCELPMFKRAEGNWDSRPLAADHTIARALGGTRADRLLHWTCNAQRGDGSRDHQRPALTGHTLTEPVAQGERLAMDW